MPEAPSPNTVRKVIDEALEERHELEAKLNEVLVTRLPKKLLCRRLACAIDLTLVNYYGQDDQEVRRSKAKDGTSRFHCYASLYVLKRNKRYTLALTLMVKDEPLLAVLKRLLKRGKELGLGIKRLLLDRGFDNNAVVQYLQEQSFASIMPLTLRGKRAKTLLKTNYSYQTSFKRSSRDYGEASFSVYVACKYSRGKYGKHGIHACAYIVIGKLSLPPLQVYEQYRLRFGIESSYRAMNEVRARTSSTSALFRLLLVGLAFLLLNLWSYLKWCYLYLRQPGPRQVLHQLLPLKTLCWWLYEVVKQRLGLRLEVYVPTRA
jgi:putative transposase